MNPVACLLLAAGHSSRFGGRKQLAMINDQPMILHSLDQLKPLFGDDIFVVLGAYAEDIQPLIKDQVHVVYHRDWTSGLGTSIARGVKHIAALNDYQAIMITLADQVGVNTSDYRRLWQRFDGERIIAARYANISAVPAIFPARYYPQLSVLEGDQGARNIIRQHQHHVFEVDMPNAQLDIDTPVDVMRFLENKSDTAKISL